MLKGLKEFFEQLGKDKEEIKEKVKKETTKEERSTYRIWLFCLNVLVLTLFSLAFLPAAPWFLYCMHRSYRWMKDGNKKDE